VGQRGEQVSQALPHAPPAPDAVPARAPAAAAPTSALRPVPTSTLQWLRVADGGGRATAAAARRRGAVAPAPALAVADHRDASDAMPVTTRVAAMWM